MQFALTFGQKYKREPHPTLGLRPDIVDGWLTIEADDEMEARRKIHTLIGGVYAFLYGPGHDLSQYHELGCLGSLEEAVEQATKAAYLVGLPVWVALDGTVTVDMGEMGSALNDAGAPYGLIRKLDVKYLGTLREARVVMFATLNTGGDPCSLCGAPVHTWRTSDPEGDSETHGHCLNRSCTNTW